jgi:hypothetical protein
MVSRFSGLAFHSFGSGGAIGKVDFDGLAETPAFLRATVTLIP